eukprot:TRINITY_DN5618_c0_g1_i1.p1 TRINITY_DN5618_c0_g1~~TRINITY_DN5618_c0_g1_i1.p1  ORF type:complete len:238 (-),score=22.07 TRINITY_DN5618_c0_g1_i1:1328-2041(-)
MSAPAFSGTQTKCKSCEKTVYLVDQLIVDNYVFHRACFRCTHCKGTLKLGSYASIEGVLYCKPHFEQLFKQTGSLQKSFQDAIKEEKAAPGPDAALVGIGRPKATTTTEKKPLTSAQKRFSGTQDKCVACGKTVYPLEKVAVENLSYHKNCFKCVHGNCRISLANYAALEGKLYCKPHYSQLFAIKGNYTELNKNATPTPTAVSGGTEAPPPPVSEPTPAPAPASTPEPAATPATAE